MGASKDLLSNTAQAERLHTFAHDLRNRLAGIQQVLGHLASRCAIEEDRELLTFGEQQHFKALREVEQLLDDMGVVRGVGHLELTSVGLRELLEKVIGQLDHRYQRKHQVLELEMPNDLRVLADAHYLGEVLHALISNASKFAAAGATIRVRAEQMGRSIRLSVTDPGVGLLPADLDMVFVRYAWLSSRSTAGEAQGRSTLARARQWAQAMKGDLSVHSDGPGTGSTFTLELAAA